MLIIPGSVTMGLNDLKRVCWKGFVVFSMSHRDVKSFGNEEVRYFVDKDRSFSSSTEFWCVIVRRYGDR